MPADLIYEDGIYTAVFPVSLPEFSAPFPQVNLDYVLTQDWVCNLAAFVPLALNTPHPDYASFLLVREDQKRDIGGGKVQWTRTYAKVPASWQTSQTINFTFPGFESFSGGSGARDPYAKTVVARTVNEYFLCAAGQTYPMPSDIPVFPMFQAYLIIWGEPVSYTNLLRMPLSSSGGSSPSIDEYLAIISSTPTSPGANGAYENELVAQDSAINQWMGNIYVRQTSYIKAQ